MSVVPTIAVATPRTRIRRRLTNRHTGDGEYARVDLGSSGAAALVTCPTCGRRTLVLSADISSNGNLDFTCRVDGATARLFLANWSP